MYYTFGTRQQDMLCNEIMDKKILRDQFLIMESLQNETSLYLIILKNSRSYLNLAYVQSNKDLKKYQYLKTTQEV